MKMEMPEPLAWRFLPLALRRARDARGAGTARLPGPDLPGCRLWCARSGTKKKQAFAFYPLLTRIRICGCFAGVRVRQKMTERG